MSLLIGHTMPHDEDVNVLAFPPYLSNCTEFVFTLIKRLLFPFSLNVSMIETAVSSPLSDVKDTIREISLNSWIRQRINVSVQLSRNHCIEI